MPLTQENRKIEINTKLENNELILESFRMRESLGRPFEIKVRLLSENPDIDFKNLLRTNATIRINLPNENEPRFLNGIFTSMRYVSAKGIYSVYEAVLSPRILLLDKISNCRIFQDKSVDKIITEIFKEANIEDIEDLLSKQYEELDYCVQYRETSFNFVTRLMEQAGIYYYFKHENGKHTLVLADAISAHKAFPQYDTLCYRPDDNKNHGKESIFDWQVGQSVEYGRFRSTDFNFETARTNLDSVAEGEPHNTSDTYVHYDYPGKYSTLDSGESYLSIRKEQYYAESLVASAQTYARGICVGHTFSLEEFPRADQNIEHLVVGVEIEAQNELPESLAQMDRISTFKCSFNAIPNSTQFRLKEITAKPILTGTQTAIVTGPEGEEINTDEYGRIQVRFHWDKLTESGKETSCRIRVGQVWNGSNWGALFIPRVNTEVIVSFLEGDPDKPLVVGCLYNQASMPPHTLSERKTRSGIRSKTYKDTGFNEICFEDKSDKEVFFARAQKDMLIQAGNNVEVRIGDPEDKEQVDGDLVTKVFGNEQKRIEKNLIEKISDSHHLEIEKDKKELIHGKKQLKVEKNCEVNAENILMETRSAISQASDKILIKGSGSVNIKGSKINLEGDTINIKSGGNFVSVGKSGVTIVGTVVKINSGGSADGAADTLKPEQFDVVKPKEACKFDGEDPVKMTEFTPVTIKSSPDYIAPVDIAQQTAEAAANCICPPPENVCEDPERESQLNVWDVEKSGNRKPNSDNILQIVPEPAKEMKFSLRNPFDDDMDSEDRDILVEAKMNYSPKTDDIHAELKLIKGPNDKHELKLYYPGETDVGWIDSQKEIFNVKGFDKFNPFYSNSGCCRCATVYGDGNDGAKTPISLEIYPSTRYSLEINPEAIINCFFSIFDKVGSLGVLVKGLIQTPAKKSENKTKGFKPIIETEYCKGKIGFERYWEEDPKDWRVYNKLNLYIHLDPLIQVVFRWRVSVFELAAKSIPTIRPLVTLFEKIAKYTKVATFEEFLEKCIDLKFILEVEFNTHLDFDYENKYYPYAGSTEKEKANSLNLDLKFKTELLLTGKWTTYVKASGSFESGFSAKNVKFKMKELILCMSLNGHFDGLKGRVQLKLALGCILFDTDMIDPAEFVEEFTSDETEYSTGFLASLKRGVQKVKRGMRKVKNWAKEMSDYYYDGSWVLIEPVELFSSKDFVKVLDLSEYESLVDEWDGRSNEK